MALNSSSASVMSDETGCKLSVGMTDENSIGRIVVTISCSRAREQEWVMTAISEHSDGFIMKHTPSPLPSKDAVIQPMWWIRKSGVSVELGVSYFSAKQYTAVPRMNPIQQSCSQVFYLVLSSD